MTKTTFTEDDRTLLTCIKSDYDYICEQFIQMKAQLQRMESHIQRQEEELAALHRERNAQPATTQREKQEERHFSPTLEAPGRIQ